MPHRYDACTKYLLEVRLADWLPLSGRTSGAPTRIVEAEVSTVTAAANRVLLVEEPEPWILHIEAQSGRDPLLPDRSQMYNTLIGWRHRVPVRTLVVLLRSAADGPELTGVLERRFPEEPPYLAFRYQIVRLWQLPVQTCLESGLGLVPLAPLSAVTEAELPAVVARMRQRIGRETTAAEAATLWTAADVLMGLRFSRGFVNELLRGVAKMRESDTYQAIVEEGRLEEARRLIMDLGVERFGEPSQDIQGVISRIVDIDRLRRLHRHLLKAATWHEFLAAT